MIPRKPREAKELSSRNIVVHRSVEGPSSVIVGVACKTPLEDRLSDCLNSIARQRLDNIGVVLLLDGLDSSDWISQVSIPESLKGSVWLLTGHCGSPSRARNAILDFVEQNIPTARWFVRLDADDTFQNAHTLSQVVLIGEKKGVEFVLCGNKVFSQQNIWLQDNSIASNIKQRSVLLRLLQEMSEGTAKNELPSCNLVIRLQCGHRYPDMSSAEDHWLVASNLFFHPEAFVVLDGEFLINYHVDGRATEDAKQTATYTKAREALFQAAQMWTYVDSLPGEILGFGQEGVLRVHKDQIIKHYYPTILTEEHVCWLSQNLDSNVITPVPKFEFDNVHMSWVARYPFEETTPFVEPNPTAVREFLNGCLHQEIVCANVKRSNFRVRQDGSLVYIDVGKWIIPMNVSYFLDASARLYSIGVLGADDEELQRRVTDESRPQIWKTLPGFEAFYGDLLTEWAHRFWMPHVLPEPLNLPVLPDVTLLIKTCAMDVAYLYSQVTHIVEQLSSPREFANVVLLIDVFEGPFLRQYAQADLQRVKQIAQQLKDAGVINEIWLSPSEKEQIVNVNEIWFGVRCEHTHSTDGVPVVPQVWAFDRIETPFVLQADLDVLIGRVDIDHDYLMDMMAAIDEPDVVCVAFNIPNPSGFRPYNSPSGEYKPEVRLGLLDLTLLKRILPLPASVQEGCLDTTWYRALHESQRRLGLRTVRGGDSRTFYIHPLNEQKYNLDKLSMVRDLVSQGRFPDTQCGKWDLISTKEWKYCHRTEDIVVVALGRNVSEDKLSRFSQGLAIQSHQHFGVIVIDDASDIESSCRFVRTLSWLGSRMTLIRHQSVQGRVDNYYQAIREVCTNLDTMIVVVDQDDALLHPNTIQDIHEAYNQGNDIVLSAPFRPDDPTKIYTPDFTRIFQTYGGDVWIHLRSFQKKLFDELASDVFVMNDTKLGAQLDYAMMIPMVLSANNPIYFPRYRYWHERTTVLDEESRQNRDLVIEYILNAHCKSEYSVPESDCETIKK